MVRRSEVAISSAPRIGKILLNHCNATTYSKAKIRAKKQYLTDFSHQIS
ncbi:Uncharacterized protein BM_BM385 [Brugia malayi]|uniref:Bm385 n=1 Tax=Brugia malayi TaxID=6279 RepID=A0A0J9XS00_BRUMA|nr:Uncharacterized protein BM_BM385 [Brugia malayi]CDP94153.1 Bm385 [Brugia malayi]VIO88695.1 Uncharacterized protein BM_BM385 [Brugia malayi]